MDSNNNNKDICIAP